MSHPLESSQICLNCEFDEGDHSGDGKMRCVVSKTENQNYAFYDYSWHDTQTFTPALCDEGHPLYRMWDYEVVICIPPCSAPNSVEEM